MSGEETDERAEIIVDTGQPDNNSVSLSSRKILCKYLRVCLKSISWLEEIFLNDLFTDLNTEKRSFKLNQWCKQKN